MRWCCVSLLWCVVAIQSMGDIVEGVGGITHC